MLDEGLLTLVREHMRSVRQPSHQDRVYRDECVFSFDSPESPGGLYVNLNTFQAVGEEFLALDHQRTGQHLYLHQKWKRVPVPKDVAMDVEDGPDVSNPPRLSGVTREGLQLDPPRYTYDKTHNLVVFPGMKCVTLPCPDLPEVVLQCIDRILAHDSASHQESLVLWEEERQVSKHAEGLPQLDTGRKISPNPKEWKCDATGEHRDNLWLNLSTGFIGSGRQNWDGSGGQGTALKHYEETGRQFPLVVKLGTITPSGADVFSYAEDDMVIDPYLDKHLAHWGINMMQMQKTEKTMAEMNMDINLTYDFSQITESTTQLTPLYGPGHVGLQNLGNSCYMNSVLQVLFTLPEVSQVYTGPSTKIFQSAPQDPTQDIATQLAKVGIALVDGRTGLAAPQEGDGVVDLADLTSEQQRTNSVKPLSFKTLVGRGHPEFSSGRQQDAVEYFQYLMEVMNRTEHAAKDRLEVKVPTSSLFNFQVEDRIQCMESGRVSYRHTVTNTLSLDIPLEAAVNKEEVTLYKEREAKRQRLKEVPGSSAYIPNDLPSSDSEGPQHPHVTTPNTQEDPVIPRVPFEACLQSLVATGVVEDYFSAALGRKTAATKHSRLGTFPPYLVVQMKRYYVDQDWTPKKMEVLVEVPEVLDLEWVRGRGPQPGEVLQPEEPEGDNKNGHAAAAAAAGGPPAVVPDPNLVAQLVAMGFSEPGSQRAAMAVNNSSVEMAMEWVISHMEDPDFNDPLAAPSSQAPAGRAVSPNFPPEQLQMLSSMGFSERQATAALTACAGSMERAGDWLFSHMDGLEAAVELVLQGGPTEAVSVPPPAAGSSTNVVDGRGCYQLLGLISHMGSNTACGHYVCHIKKDNQWVIFNDEKVAASAKPPLALGYMYIFQRMV